jgi:hypothetical protein
LTFRHSQSPPSYKKCPSRIIISKEGTQWPQSENSINRCIESAKICRRIFNLGANAIGVPIGDPIARADANFFSNSLANLETTGAFVGTPESPRSGLLTFEHQGCRHFVEEEELWDEDC